MALVLSHNPSPKERGAATLISIKKLFIRLLKSRFTSSFQMRYPSSAPLSFGEGLWVRTTG